jgi:RHS repeat-associated protein
VLDNGQYQDDESTLYYLRARYYNPNTGQFTSRDPLETQTGQPYEYANNDPLDNSDPSGAFCLGDICTHFDPAAGLHALVNIGRGATFGLTDKLDNWISPGASCTVAHSSLDEFIGAAATTTVLGELRAIRATYVAATRGIPAVADSPEEAYQLRNALKAFARGRTPAPFRWLAQARQTEPFDQLLARKGAEQVIAGAGRTNPWVNFGFGLW